MKQFLLMTIVLTSLWGLAMIGTAVAQQNEKPLRVYFIHSPHDNLWYRSARGLGVMPLNFVKWDKQEKASVWTIRKEAERAKGQMLGNRAKNSKIKAFILLPAFDNK